MTAQNAFLTPGEGALNDCTDCLHKEAVTILYTVTPGTKLDTLRVSELRVLS